MLLGSLVAITWLSPVIDEKHSIIIIYYGCRTGIASSHADMDKTLLGYYDRQFVIKAGDVEVLPWHITNANADY